MSGPKPAENISTRLDWEATSELLHKLNNTKQIIPESTMLTIMQRSGCSVEDPKVAAMLETYVRFYLSNIIKEAQGYHMLSQNPDPKMLTREDLSYALRVFGIENHNPQYFTSNPQSDKS